MGSLYVNGTARDIVDPLYPEKYIGIDVRPGPGVDLVCDAADLLKTFAPESVGAVVCVSTLEHCQDWWRVFLNMKTVLRPEGFMYFAVPSPGFQYHPEPDDYWRFSLQGVYQMFADFGIWNLENDTQAPGVFCKAKKPQGWMPQTVCRIIPYKTVEGPL